jgi:3',5'-cyclic AMP phosphodiesterase CpdA
VFTTGDNAYSRGTRAEFRRCYDPSWGQFRSRTRPAAGNHDFLTNTGAPYFAYFGAAAGTAPDGWYSYDSGTWHVVVLNSNCAQVGGCGEGSRQLAWLQADLAAHPVACTVAIWHHPRFSSGEHGSDIRSADFWNVLYAAGAELVLNGHDHDYERFAPQDPEARLDPARGIREFVVGTGGESLRLFNPRQPVANSEVRGGSYGILVLDLAPGGYDWHFVGVQGRGFSDNGSGTCH